MQIKTSTVREKRQWIYAQDEAFDPELFDDDEYSLAMLANDASRWGAMLRPDQTPAIWTYRVPTGRVRLHLETLALQGQLSTLIWDAVRLCLVGVTNLISEKGDVIVRQKARHPEAKAPCVDDETMNLLSQVDDGALVSTLGTSILLACKIIDTPTDEEPDDQESDQGK